MQGLPLLDRRKIGTECRVSFYCIEEMWGQNTGPSSWVESGRDRMLGSLLLDREWKGQNAGFPPLG